VSNAVEHPPHYTAHSSGVEAIDLCEFLTFNVGNALKYCWRAGLKTESKREDLMKAQWYLKRELNPPRVSMLSWLFKLLVHPVGLQLPWPVEFDVVRTQVLKHDTGLVGQFLVAFGVGNEKGVERVLEVVERHLKEVG